MTTERAESVARDLRGWSPDQLRSAAASRHLEVVCRCASSYPEPLRPLHDPPPVLYVRGNSALLGACPDRTLAMVGTRHPTRTGRDAARRLAAGVAARGGLVVSGMALGIDAAAHEGALSVAAPTVAVLASGADRPTPGSHRQLYDEILDAGAVVSEMPPGCRPFRWSFPARNRIIATLATITVVVEAPRRSGALITAEQATDLGRDVMAVPGALSSDVSAGTNHLLQEGAGAAVDPIHLAGLLGLSDHGPASGVRPALVPGPGGAVHAALTRGPASVAELERSVASRLGPAEVEDALLDLELGGIVERGIDSRYRLVAP